MAAENIHTDYDPSKEEVHLDDDANKQYELGQITLHMAKVMSGINVEDNETPQALDTDAEVSAPKPKKRPKRVPMSARRKMFVDIGGAASIHKSQPYGHKEEADSNTGDIDPLEP